MKKISCIFLSLLFVHHLSAQLVEDFNDDDLNLPNMWVFTSNTWKTSATGQLQSANTTPNSLFSISTLTSIQVAQQWQFTVQLDFNPSSTNYVDVYLQADSVDITKMSCVGYFVRLGNTQDEISLYRKNKDGSSTKIIDGQDGVLNKTDNRLSIKVIRKKDYSWILWRDSTATNSQWTIEGNTIDNTYSMGNYVGIAVRQSTNSFFEKHFFDDIILSPYTPDVTPPIVTTVEVKQAQQINIHFSEPINRLSVYKDSLSITPDVSIDTFLFLNNNTIQLTLKKPLTSKTFYQLTLKNIADVEGNALKIYNQSILWNNPEKYDLLITEIMADPDPVVQLPNAEYIEIYNRTAFPFILDEWKLTVGSNTTTLKNTIPAYSYTIVCNQTNVALFPNTISIIGVSSFPSLNNTGDTITLRNPSNNIIHSMYYTNTMHENSIKQNGGWSLELKDTATYCIIDGNWTSSSNEQGGTPGKSNSTYQSNATIEELKIMACIPLLPTQLQVTFNHPTDSTSLTNVNHYMIDGSAYTISAVQTIPPLYQTALLQLSVPLQELKPITLHISGIQRCDGLAINDQSIQTGRSSVAQSGDIIFNEILFNPKSGGSDFIELYNRSNKIIDCNQLLLSASLQMGGTTFKLSGQPLLLFPRDYIVCTENKSALLKQYWVKDPQRIIECTSLPSLPNDKGTIVLTNKQGIVIDSLAYSEKWHFPLLHDVEGISLERSSFEGNTNDAANWHSAASTAGFATPGSTNSQFIECATTTNKFSLSTKTFSPNQDGFEDYALIHYQMNQPGAVAHITIFNLQGRAIKTLARNATLGNSGAFKWDGTTDTFTLAAQGTYIIYCDVFTLDGKRWKEKLAITLAKNN